MVVSDSTFGQPIVPSVAHGTGLLVYNYYDPREAAAFSKTYCQTTEISAQ